MATVKRSRPARVIAGALALAKHVGALPAAKMSLDYDDEADVLYISLQRPQQATETIEDDEDNVLLHYRDRKLVGITVLDASKH